MDEEWRAVPGYEESYEVSSLGNLRSKDRFAYFIKCGKPHKMFIRGGAHKTFLCSNGYSTVAIK